MMQRSGPQVPLNFSADRLDDPQVYRGLLETAGHLEEQSMGC